jgi:hypothetical protein
MLIKNAICEDATICSKCHSYHAPNVDCSRVFTEESLSGHTDSKESINKNCSDVTSLCSKGVTNEK